MVAYMGTYETNQHYVIQQEHDCCEFICDLTLAECVVPEIADVLDLRVLHDKFMHRQRSDVE